jgi:glyoxalase family protein
VAAKRSGDSVVFFDPEGLSHALIVDASGEAPLRASAPDVPSEHALLGFAGVRAYGWAPARSAPLLRDALGFVSDGDAAWRVGGSERSSTMVYDPPPDAHGIPGAGTIHHVAFAARMDEQEEWRLRVARAGARPTPVIDRFYFKSVYFREPSGVLFELATMGPGFAVDEPAESLGERLSLPPAFEQYRAQVEATLTPLPDVRAESVTRVRR